MTAPDPGLTDLIAAHYRTITTAVIYRDDESDGAHRKGFECVCACGDEYMASTRAGDRTEATVLRRADSAHVALVVEQHTNGRIAELEAENVRLRAQVASIGHVHPGTCSPVETHPDDREINEAIDESECFADAMFEIAEKYGANVTNNMDRWQDGVFLRHIAEFTEDVETAALKHLRAALEGEQ